jgi:trehalose 6-phosphate synthase
MLRKKHQNIVLQQFIHIPSPEPENLSKPENLHDRPSEIVEDIYKGLSGKDIYKGLSGNDILGFQTKKDATNFLEGVKRFLPDDAKVNLNESTISWENGHSTQVRVYPISIDVDKTREMANAANRESAKEMKKIISVGRMDPTKNDVRIFRGYDLMLEQHPEVRGSVIFAPRLVPSRQEVPAYQQLRQDIEETIKGTNEQFGDGSYTPIQPNYGNDQMHAVGQMASADVVAVIPEKDGMNMVALEAVSIMEDGVLVLSEKAGAHEQLKEGVLSVGDPKNIKEIADRIFEALKMSPEERQRRTAVARKVVEKNDLFQWQFNQFSDIYEVLKSK